MHSRKIVLTILLTLFFCFPLYLLSEIEGAPVRRTGGNFPGEQSCATSDCHGGTPNSGPGSVSIAVNGMPASEYRYTPGQTVPVSVTVMDPDQMRWGFEITARTPNGCSQAGAFSGSGDMFVNVSPMDSEATPPCTPEPIQFPTHSFPKSGASAFPGGATFELNWTAPDTDIGPIIFAAAGNAANGDNENTGDRIYTTQGTVEPEQTQSPPPSIGSGGVVLATGTPFVSEVTKNSIITIFGQEFAPPGTSVLGGQLDENGKVSTLFADTCVEIGGDRGPIFDVLAGQLNVQVPHTVGLGQASVVVVRGCGTPNEQRSAPEPIVVAGAAPAFFNFLTILEGQNPIAAVHLQGPVLLLGDPSLGDVFPGSEFAPAEPGELVLLFGTGFGETAPAFEAGEIPLTTNPESPAAPLPEGTTVNVTIGGLAVAPEDIPYIGISPCCAGLYQLTVPIPENAPDGDLPVVLTINGVSSPQGPFLTVKRP